jgi:hypothetical protein
MIVLGDIGPHKKYFTFNTLGMVKANNIDIQ